MPNSNPNIEAIEIDMKRRSQMNEIIQRFLKNKKAVVGLVIIVLLLLCALFPSVIAPYGYDEQNYAKAFTPPGTEYLFGADNFGRDIFSRVVYGCRTSLAIGIVSIAFSSIVGVILGCIAGFYSDVDNFIMRLMDILLAIPNTLLAMSIVAVLGTGFSNLMIAIGTSNVPRFARIVRAAVLTVKEQEYIEAARSVGAKDVRVIMKHILPNCMAPIIVQATMSIANAILAASALSFIGLGISPPTPEWGSMLSAARAYMRDYWFVVAFPGLAIVATVFAFNLFGDGLRDALDPRLKR